MKLALDYPGTLEKLVLIDILPHGYSHRRAVDAVTYIEAVSTLNLSQPRSKMQATKALATLIPVRIVKSSFPFFHFSFFSNNSSIFLTSKPSNRRRSSENTLWQTWRKIKQRTKLHGKAM